MLHILLVTPRLDSWHGFADALSSDSGVRLEHAASGAAALEAVGRAAPQLAIIDAGLPDISPLDLVRKLLMVNALVNTAVVSDLNEAQFHEASEGLGILGRLPVNPGRDEAADLLGKLKAVLGGLG